MLGAVVPETKYVKSGDVHIAYAVLGQGPIDLIFIPGWVTHFELAWENPHQSRFLRRLASFSRHARGIREHFLAYLDKAELTVLRKSLSRVHEGAEKSTKPARRRRTPPSKA
jgi:hypothetical protein